MAWNHRILAHEYNGEIYFMIHEVSYNENNIPYSYTERATTVGGEDLKSITWILYRMLECRNKPILWAGEKFPKEFKKRVIKRCFCGAAWDGITCNHCGFDASDVDIY